MSGSSSLIINNWEFQPLNLSGRDEIEGYMHNSTCANLNMHCDFAYLYFYNDTHKKVQVIWKVVGGLLFLFEWWPEKKRLKLLGIPFGKAEPEHMVNAVYICMGFCSLVNLENQNITMVQTVDEVQLAYLKQSPLFEKLFQVKQRTGIEHHYNIEKICALKGKEFSYIRRKLAKFNRHFPDYHVRPYQDEDYTRLVELFDQWVSTFESAEDRKKKMRGKVSYMAMLNNYKPMNHTILVIEVNQSIIGMVSGGLSSNQYSWCNMRKPLKYYEGLSELLVVELAKALRLIDPSIKYLNDGSDLGIAGLRYFKQRFKPERTLKRYRIFLADRF